MPEDENIVPVWKNDLVIHPQVKASLSEPYWLQRKTLISHQYKVSPTHFEYIKQQQMENCGI